MADAKFEVGLDVNAESAVKTFNSLNASLNKIFKSGAITKKELEKIAKLDPKYVDSYKGLAGSLDKASSRVQILGKKIQDLQNKAKNGLVLTPRQAEEFYGTVRATARALESVDTAVSKASRSVKAFKDNNKQATNQLIELQAILSQMKDIKKSVKLVDTKELDKAERKVRSLIANVSKTQQTTGLGVDEAQYKKRASAFRNTINEIEKEEKRLTKVVDQEEKKRLKSETDVLRELERMRKQSISRAEQLEKLATRKESAGVFSKADISKARGDAEAARKQASNLGRVQQLYGEVGIDASKLNKILDTQKGKFDKLTGAVHNHTVALEHMHRGNWFVEITKRAAMYAGAFSLLYGATNALREGARYVVEFDKVAGNLAAVLDINRDYAESLERQIVGLGTAYGSSLENINKAALELARAGVASKDLVGATEVVMKMALLTGDTVETSSGAIITFFEVFGQGAGKAGYSAEQLGDKLAYVANSSKLTTQDIATFSNYALTAAQSAGATVDTIGALASVFSRLGLNASTIGTQMRTLFFGLREDSTNTQAVFDGLGLSQEKFLERMQKGGAESEQALIDFGQALKDLSDGEFNQLIQGVDKLYAQSLTNLRLGLGELKTSLKDIKDSQGALNKSTKETVDTLAVSWERVENAIGGVTVDMTGPLADGAKEVLQSFADMVGTTDTLGDNFEEIGKVVIAGATALGIYRLSVIAATANINLLQVSLATSVVQLRLQAIAATAASVAMRAIPYVAIASGVYMAANAFSDLTKNTNESYEAIDKVKSKMVDMSQEQMRNRVSQLELKLKSADDYAKRLQKAGDKGTIDAVRAAGKIRREIQLLKTELEDTNLAETGDIKVGGKAYQTFTKGDEQIISDMISNLKALYETGALTKQMYDDITKSVRGSIQVEREQLAKLTSAKGADLDVNVKDIVSQISSGSLEVAGAALQKLKKESSDNKVVAFVDDVYKSLLDISSLKLSTDSAINTITDTTKLDEATEKYKEIQTALERQQKLLASERAGGDKRDSSIAAIEKAQNTRIKLETDLNNLEAQRLKVLGDMKDVGDKSAKYAELELKSKNLLSDIDGTRLKIMEAQTDEMKAQNDLTNKQRAFSQQVSGIGTPSFLSSIQQYGSMYDTGVDLGATEVQGYSKEEFIKKLQLDAVGASLADNVMNATASGIEEGIATGDWDSLAQGLSYAIAQGAGAAAGTAIGGPAGGIIGAAVGGGLAKSVFGGGGPSKSPEQIWLERQTAILEQIRDNTDKLNEFDLTGTALQTQLSSLGEEAVIQSFSTAPAGGPASGGYGYNFTQDLNLSIDELIETLGTNPLALGNLNLTDIGSQYISEAGSAVDQFQQVIYGIGQASGDTTLQLQNAKNALIAANIGFDGTRESYEAITDQVQSYNSILFGLDKQLTAAVKSGDELEQLKISKQIEDLTNGTGEWFEAGGELAGVQGDLLTGILDNYDAFKLLGDEFNNVSDSAKDFTEQILGMRDQLMGTDLLGEWNRSQALQTLQSSGLVNSVATTIDEAFGSAEGLDTFLSKLDISSLTEDQVEALQVATDYFSTSVIDAAQYFQDAIGTAQNFIDQQQGLIDKIRGSQGTPEANVSYLADRYQQELSRVQRAQQSWIAAQSDTSISEQARALIAAEYESAQGRYMNLAEQYSDSILETYKSSATGQALLDSIVADQESNISQLSIERDIWLSQLKAQEDTSANTAALLEEIRVLNATNAVIAEKDWTLVYDPAQATTADTAYLNSLS